MDSEQFAVEKDRIHRTQRWLYYLNLPETKEEFAIAETRGKKSPGKYLNFWYRVEKQVSLYTFVPAGKFDKKGSWNEKRFRKLLAELRKPTPRVEVVRFAVNGKFFFVKDDSFTANEVPEFPNLKPGWTPPCRKAHPKVFEIEAQRANEPAPFILYGKHYGSDKEYAWKLNPDKPKRQGIQPGDRVEVWTKNGWCIVTCTKIEKVDRRKTKKQPRPTCRVKRKLQEG